MDAKCDEHCPVDVANCIGAFTQIPRVAQDFFAAGLPVWFLRPAKEFISANHKCNIREIVPVTDGHDVLCVSPHDPPFEVIFTGDMDDRRKHFAVQAYFRTWLMYQNPFRDDRSNDSSSSSHLTPNAPSLSIAQTNQTTQGKFVPLHLLLFSDMIIERFSAS